MHGRIERGGGGSGSPLFCPCCRLFNIGPKVGPPPGPLFLLVNLRWTPFSKILDPPCNVTLNRDIERSLGVRGWGLVWNIGPANNVPICLPFSVSCERR